MQQSLIAPGFIPGLKEKDKSVFSQERNSFVAEA